MVKQQFYSGILVFLWVLGAKALEWLQDSYAALDGLGFEFIYEIMAQVFGEDFNALWTCLGLASTSRVGMATETLRVWASSGLSSSQVFVWDGLFSRGGSRLGMSEGGDLLLVASGKANSTEWSGRLYEAWVWLQVHRGYGLAAVVSGLIMFDVLL